MRVGLVILALALAACAPASAHADAAWTCSASGGWLAAGGQRIDSPAAGGEPCPDATAASFGATGAPGSLSGSGSASTAGGSGSQTTDARQPSASSSAQSLTIRNSDGSLVLTSSNLKAVASASCDSNRQPLFASSGTPGTVTLNGNAISTSSDYSEPGVGVNGAPLLGKITIHFNEIARTATGITRRAIHLIVTDSSGAVVFEAVAGEVSTGADGDVCAPPPVCPAGQQSQGGSCVDVTVSPLPPPPGPVSALPPGPIGGGTGSPQQGPTSSPHATGGCEYADARAGQAAPHRLVLATLCLLNVVRRQHHLPRLRLSVDLSRAAQRHARNMVVHRYFGHTEPGGVNIVDRILHSGYLSRYGHWRLGENLGWGWGSGATPRSIVTAWMRSAPHRHNILNRAFRDVGVAVVTGSPRQPRSGAITYVIDFGGFQAATRAR